MVAHLTRLLGPSRLDLAEEIVQEAMLRALQTWPHRGVPENPEAWLFRVARNGAIDALRLDRLTGRNGVEAATDLTPALTAAPEDAEFEEELRDGELRMIFMCCHPEIPPSSRVALSLKTVGGFSVREIARAFLTDDATIAQRLVRSKRRIRDFHISFQMPRGAQLQQRLDSVLEVIYLLFNEGYAAHEGEDLIRQDLCFEALRLGRLIASSSIAAPRVHALMAMMALKAARSSTRTDEAGDLVLLEDQDPSRWDHQLIALGFHHFNRSMAGEEISEYHVQAAIAATHARAGGPRTVDWPAILALYDQLAALNPSPVVALNRAVAIAKVRGPKEALVAIDPLASDAKMDHYYLHLALRGRLLLDLGRRVEAADCFRDAMDCRCSEPERRFLRRQIVACGIDRKA